MTDLAQTSIPTLVFSKIGQLVGVALRQIGAQYARAPLAAGGLTLIAILGGLAANNALFGQQGTHPAPLFFSAGDTQQNQQIHVSAPVPAPPPSVQAASLPTNTPQPTATVSSPVAEPVVSPENVELATGRVTNEQLAAAQHVLAQLGLFGEQVDGFYGPKTAAAIRAFELREGLTPTGALDPHVINLILQTDLSQGERTSRISTDSSARVTIVEASPQPSVNSEPVTNSAGTSAGSGQDALAALLASNRGESATIVTQETRSAAATPAVTVETQATVAALEPEMDAAPQVVETDGNRVVVDRDYIEKVQRALASLAFLQGPIDGVAGEDTALAIRKFEIFNKYEATGRVTPELLDMLVEAGASID